MGRAKLIVDGLPVLWITVWWRGVERDAPTKKVAWRPRYDVYLSEQTANEALDELRSLGLEAQVERYASASAPPIVAENARIHIDGPLEELT